MIAQGTLTDKDSQPIVGIGSTNTGAAWGRIVPASSTGVNDDPIGQGSTWIFSPIAVGTQLNTNYFQAGLSPVIALTAGASTVRLVGTSIIKSLVAPTGQLYNFHANVAYFNNPFVTMLPPDPAAIQFPISSVDSGTTDQSRVCVTGQAGTLCNFDFTWTVDQSIGLSDLLFMGFGWDIIGGGDMPSATQTSISYQLYITP